MTMDATDDKQSDLDGLSDEATPAAQTVSRADSAGSADFEDFAQDLQDVSELARPGPSKRFWTVLISSSTVASFVLSFGISRMITADRDGSSPSPSVAQAARTLEPAEARAQAEAS